MNDAVKVALVTGSAQGVGEAIARRLHAEGLHVVMADAADERNRSTAADIDPSGSRADPVVVDLRDEHAVARVVEQTIDRLGRIDVLVNNAAVANGTSLWDVTVDEWENVLATNLRATFLLSRAVGEHMREQGGGRIVNISSLAAQAARPSGVHYAASKAGILALTRIFATELAPHGVTVNAVAPGTLETPMMQAVSAEVRDRLIASIPLGRIGSPEEVAALVVFLISEEASFTTGATYDINGGVLMR
ncbi:MAG: 3-oxoacyl-ACP reductase FabG [Candidatus Leucobacter sulfamidivorax]|nr:3-oxoacyl-ACP reductase FabG [Candidatus Leucobacter sulfamidivorax]